MKTRRLFQVLETDSSEVIVTNLFNTGCTVHIPDFFVVFFCLSVLCSSTLSDIYVAYQLFCNGEVILLGIFSTTIVARIVFELFLEKRTPSENLPLIAKSAKFLLIIYVLGFGSIFVCTKILWETYSSKRPAVKRSYCPSFPIFHISKESVSFIKIYCFINLAFKSIPQLLVLPIIILGRDVNTETRVAVMTSTLLNIVIFSSTIALTLPVRSTPRVFASTPCAFINGISKFMATACACFINILVFVVTFRGLQYYALSIYLIKFLLWIWPCWKLLKSQVIKKAHFPLHLVIITLIFTFIYIHPFRGQGKAYYYFLYLLNFLCELVFIYLTSETTFEVLSYFCTLKILMLGFLSCFGLLNVLHKEKYECISHSSVKSKETENSENSVSEINTRYEVQETVPDEGGRNEKSLTSDTDTEFSAKSPSSKDEEKPQF